MIGREDEVRQYRDRVILFYGLVAALLGVIGIRLFYLQILQGEELRRFSESNRLKKERLFPTRGTIFDRNGKVIVDNRAAFDVILLAQYYPFDEATDARLAKALGMPPAELEKKLAKVRKSPTFHPVLLKSDVSKDVIAAIETNRDLIPGVDIETTVQRRYPMGDFASQVLGYIGEVDRNDIRKLKKRNLEQGDFIGKAGVERQYDNHLRGVNGVGYVEVDAKGRRKLADADSAKLLGYVTQTDPIPGQDLTLTIDADLELAATQALRSRDFHGSVVALDPRNGELLAVVNDPSYDPSVISTREIDTKLWQQLSTNKERPLRNRFIQDHYPPGSTFKLFMALAGLSEGLIPADFTTTCSGSMRFGNRRFHCWKTHGTVDFVKSIRESCDVFYYQLGNQLGIDRIAKYARMFGLGSRTGIAMAGEQPGLIPDSDWKLKTYKQPWHPGETVSVAIGQGYVATTPLQLANAFAAIGNGGFLYKPTIVKKIEDSSGKAVKDIKPELIRKIEIAPEHLEMAKEGLYQVVNRPGGTAVGSYSQFSEISGKTGTAQVRTFSNMMSVRCDALDRDFRHHGWFVAYAPRENPEIAVAVIAEHSCHGSSAARVVRDVMDSYFKKKNAPPEEMGPHLVNYVQVGSPLSDRAPTVAPEALRKPQSQSPAVPVRPKVNLGREEDE